MVSCEALVSRLPARKSGTGRLSGVGARGRPSKDGISTVAIIEDEKDIVEIYSHICMSIGLTISFTANDGTEGLEAFRKSSCPDVILIDHRMPRMTGIEAMGRMLDLNPDANFIMLSADEEVEEDALKAGAKAFIKKPASVVGIGSTIRKVLGQL